VVFRIALVCDYSLDCLGGAQTAFLAQARALSDAGHQVTVITPRQKTSNLTAFRNHEVNFCATVPFLGLPLIRNGPRLRKQIARVLDEENIDVVHVHSEFGLSAACCDVARTAGLPVVYTVHTFLWQFSGFALVRRLASFVIRRFHSWSTGLRDAPVKLASSTIDSALRNMTLSIARRADTVVSPSLHQRRRLLEAGIEVVEHVPNTLVVNAASRPCVLSRVDGPLRVVWIGRCDPEKRLLPFIRASLDAISRLPAGSLEIIVVGAGLQLADAQKLAGSHECFSFLGRLSQSEVLAQLEKAHVAALSSYGFDNQPMIIVEALFAQRGVLYVDPALEESISGAGILAPGPDEASISSTLVQVAQDHEIVCDLSSRAGEAFEQFTPSHFAQRIEQVHSQVTTEKKTAGASQ